MNHLTVNTNVHSGIPYGVIAGNNVPYLMDDIMSNGTDLTFKALREELLESIGAHILERGPGDSLADAIDHWDVDRLVQNIDEDDSAEDILSSLEEAGLWDMDSSEEHEYSYESEGCKLLLSYLGGAPVIYVIESPYVAPCRKCSLCIPNAGDLDSPDSDGDFAYCLSPDDMPEDWTGQGICRQEV